jgi:imidazolonepropionase
MNKPWDAIWTNGKLATCEEGHGLIDDAAIATLNGKIIWRGPMRDLPSRTPDQLASYVYDLQGALLTPGLIDCHTHIIYGGNRAQEFESRLHGASYEDIARAGGGIQSTVSETRKASSATLFQQSFKRVRALIKSGVTTIEIKSGYGLNLETELKILRVALELEKVLPVTIIKTFLGAHTIPIEYKNNRDAYVDLICNEMVPVIAKDKLADAVDVFCETIAFDLFECERIFKTARQHGLSVKCHAEQLSDSGSAALAAKYQALSVDHLEYISPSSIDAIAKSETVAVLLPGAFYFLREKQCPPIDLLRKAKIPIAIASDSNPGTSPILSLQLIMNMASTLFRLTPEEALLGVTKHAAKALGLERTHGTLTVGKVADFAIWDIHHPRELAYYAGGDLLSMLVRHGEIVDL